MIPEVYITEWSNVVPWAERKQIEQDLIITKALLDIYKHPILKETVAFRGGTALNKIVFASGNRYSEDIDLVQINNEPIGNTIDFIQEAINPWLGKPKRTASHGLVTLSYRTTSEDGFPIKLKIEINTREHFSILGFQKYEFISNSTWAPGKVHILTYKIEELLGTKMRALYQRRKGRDLYDLHKALMTFPSLNTDEIVECFSKYINNSNQSISKKEFLENMEKKLKNQEFREDILPLLSYNMRFFDPEEAYDHIRINLIEKLK